MRKMTTIQQYFLEAIANKVAQQGTNEFIYCSDYLGYLPYGQYHWITCGAEDISAELPSGFSSNDLKELEKLGKIKLLEKWVNSKDELVSKTAYKLINTLESDT